MSILIPAILASGECQIPGYNGLLVQWVWSGFWLAVMIHNMIKKG